MSEEPRFIVEYEIKTRYLSGREKDTQLIKVPSNVKQLSKGGGAVDFSITPNITKSYIGI